jgi:GNAT superfamily N-acetyltransferase
VRAVVPARPAACVWLRENGDGKPSSDVSKEPSMPTIRRATVDDARHLFPLAEAFATSFRPEAGAFRTSFDQLIDDDDARVLVADDATEIVGYLLGFDHFTFFANGRVSWVEEVTVRADRRGEGIGEALMGEFEAWARTRGSRLIGLATRRAEAFYAALGYEPSATYFRRLL